MTTLTDLTLARDLGAALLLSFSLWILAGQGLARVFRFGVCSVCGAVVTVWVANLFLGFLPGWVTLLLMGQSVVGGSTLARDTLFADRIAASPPGTRHRVVARAQLAWFGFILAGTAGLGAVGLLFALDRPLGAAEAAAGLGILLLALAASFVFWVLVFFATQRLWKWSFCHVCAAVSSVWVVNLATGILPSWVTVFLLGQTVAGAAALGRDEATRRLGLNALADGRRRIAKQATYFGFLASGTLAAVLLAAAAVSVGGL